MGVNESRPGLLRGKNILVMGLADTRSYAWAIGERALEEGANVIYTTERRAMQRLFASSAKEKGLEIDLKRDRSVLECDVTSDESVTRLFDQVEGPIHGLVHSIAYANPQTSLGENALNVPRADVQRGFDISVGSLLYVAREALTKMTEGGSIIAMTFDSAHVYEDYALMGVYKAGLEAMARFLAVQLRHQGVRVNNLSAGPQETLAATHIPGFNEMTDMWPTISPLPWDMTDPSPVADAAVYLLSNMSRMVTGQTHYVDGGAQNIRVLRPKS